MSHSTGAGPFGAEARLSSEDFRQDVLAGLSGPNKTLPCKYLYDDQGARLFEAICELDEYYPTRTELGILRDNIDEIASLLGPRVNLVDLGSGSGLKTRLLLDHLDQPASYLPVDVACAQLLQGAARLNQEHPQLLVKPICADYTRPFNLPPVPPDSGRSIVFFPGSTLGNFEPEEAMIFLGRMARLSRPTGGLLIGIDLKKSPHLLNPAYNDSRGVTAQFNLNLLARANRELPAGFDLAQFQHHAFYNAAAGRIEMHLVSCRQQTVPVDGHKFDFANGESIVTEHSYKYTVEEFRQLASRAGLEVVRHWTDKQQWFSVQYLKPRQDATDDASQARR